jgi:cytochrome P450
LIWPFSGRKCYIPTILFLSMLTRPPSLNANSNSAAYWTIVNLHNHPDILARVREEIKPYAKREGKDKRLSLDWQGLLNDCPLLKASYFESLRMD